MKENVQPRDLVGVGTVDVDKGFHLLSAFTTDRELVASAISDPQRYRGTDPLQIANQTVVFQPPEENASNQQQGGGGAGGGRAAMGDQYMREMAQQMKSGNDAYVRQRIQKQIDALAQLAATLRAVPGRKQVILLSEGFDAKYLEGRDARESPHAARYIHATSYPARRATRCDRVGCCCTSKRVPARQVSRITARFAP